MGAKMQSRKLWAAIIGTLLMVVETLAGVELDKEMIVGQLTPLLAYMGVEGLVDAFRKK